MQEMFNVLPELIELAVLVTLFLCLGRKDRSARMKLWLAGWLSVFLHFSVVLSLGVLPRAAVSFISALTIHVAGLFFLASLTAFAGHRVRCLSFLALCGVPAAFFIAAMYAHLPGRALYLVCLLAMFPGGLLLLARFERASTKQVGACVITSLPFFAWGLLSVLRADSFGGLLAVEAALFVGCGTLLWRAYSCATPGLVITSLGFWAWAAVFPGIAFARLSDAGTSIPPHLWNAPKVVVGLGMVVVLLEEESRKAAETGQRYSDLFEHNLAGVFCSTVEGSITECNSAFLSMFGYASREDLEQADASDLYPRREDRLRFIERLQKTGQVQNHEALARRKDGEVFWTMENSGLVQDASGTCLIRGTIFDITDRKSLEAQLCTAQKMEAIGRLAGGIAHDLNNLLMVISGNTEVLALRVSSNSEVTRYTRAIVAGVERAAALVNHLLAFSRKEPIAAQVVSLGGILAPLRPMLPRLIGTNIECSITVAEDTWCVKADPVQIEQVILNLATNARDAMPKGGVFTIGVRNACARDEAVPVGEYVLITVSDTGEGIEPTIQEHIFDPFFTTKEQGKGTGLGLSTAYGIVKQSGGEISVASRVGEGTTFRIYLPRCSERLQVPGPDAHDSSTPVPHITGGEVILIVDDEEGLRHSVAEYLGILGYCVLQASSGDQAVGLCRRRRIDLLLSDLVMPGTGGRDLAVLVRALHPDVKVIFMTGYEDHSSPVQDGAERWPELKKPFPLEAVAGTVRELLGRVTV